MLDNSTTWLCFSAIATTRDSNFVPDSRDFEEKAREVSLIRLCVDCAEVLEGYPTLVVTA